MSYSQIRNQKQNNMTIPQMLVLSDDGIEVFEVQSVVMYLQDLDDVCQVYCNIQLSQKEKKKKD